MITTSDISISPPYTPELLPEAQAKIEGFLQRGMRVFEYGSGCSTLWFASINHNGVMSVEHDEVWHKKVSDALHDTGLPAYVLLVPEDELANAIWEWGDFHLILVDCLDRCRNDAVEAAMQHVIPGGWLVLDDSHWPMLEPAKALLHDWPCETVSGMHRRKTGEVRYHQTSFYRRVA